MGLAIRAEGRVAKRGLVPRLPAPDRFLADVEAWIRGDYADTIRSIRTSEAEPGEARLAVQLHPAAPDLLLAAPEPGRLTAAAETAGVGPGYHTFTSRLLERLGQELDVDWTPTDEVAGGEAVGGQPLALETVDPSTATRPEVERVQLAWLRAMLDAASGARTGTTSYLGTPAWARYRVDAPLATALGPRDREWLAKAMADPRVAIDVWPWYLDTTNARYLLNRALCLMWTEIRWRPPATEEEMHVADEVLGLLRQAYPLDPSLPFPWQAWQDLLVLRGAEDPMARLIGERAARAAPDDPPIGYRRHEVTIVHEGWQLVVPGSFAERRSDDEWWGGEAGRRITVAATETGRDGRPMSAEAFLAEVAGHLGTEVLNHRADGGLIGRARLEVDPSSGVQVGVLDGYSAVTGRGAAIRVEFDDPDDWQWALDMWRSLRPT